VDVARTALIDVHALDAPPSGAFRPQIDRGASPRRLNRFALILAFKVRQSSTISPYEPRSYGAAEQSTSPAARPGR